MGFRPSVLLIAPLLLATPAFAQEQENGDPVFSLPRQPPQTDPNREGPELDVFRGAPTTVTPPPIVSPTITLPPTVAPQPSPQQPATQPQRPAPSARPPALAAPAPSERRAPATPAPAAATPEPQPTPLPQTSPESAPHATPATAPPVAEPREAVRWPWIVAGMAALGALLAAAWLFRRRRRAVEEIFEEEPLFVEEAEEAPPPPAASARPAPIPPSPSPLAPPMRAPQPAPQTGDRPWIDVAMEVRGARLSLMGATINYVLTLRNRGQRPAEDLLIRTLIANADTGQQAMLQQFFAGSVGLPTHSVVSIAPGESQNLTGELRLLPDQIAPVRMGDRALLIPLVAFDAQYRWTRVDNDVGAGRTGRAFIVGQEKSPPADRLAPFRLDLGPRQYPSPGSRATAVELAS